MTKKIIRVLMRQCNKKPANKFSAEITRKAKAVSVSIDRFSILCVRLSKCVATKPTKKSANLNLGNAKKILELLIKANDVLSERYHVFEEAMMKHPESKSKKYKLFTKILSEELIRTDEALKTSKVFLSCFE